MHEAANLARVSFVHCQAVLAKEVLSKTLPAGSHSRWQPRDVLLCCSPCSVMAESSLRSTPDFPLGSLYRELLLHPVSCCGMTGYGLALTEDQYRNN